MDASDFILKKKRWLKNVKFISIFISNAVVVYFFIQIDNIFLNSVLYIYNQLLKPRAVSLIRVYLHFCQN